jgi:hypothetical protein
MSCSKLRIFRRLYKESIEQVTEEAVSAMLPRNNQSAISDDDELTYHGVVSNADTYGKKKQSYGYCTATCFVSVFYIIPVYQFLYYHWKVCN